jgi:prevent-host-death family protein
MDEVSVRDLRNYGGQILDRVQKGETVTITRDGTPAAILSPVPEPNISTRVLLSRWQHLPRIDGELLREEIADIMNLDL